MTEIIPVPYAPAGPMYVAGVTATGPITAPSATISGPVTAANLVFTGANALRGGTGAPAAGLGNNGDYYFRSDTPATANQRIYVKSAGAWVGII